MCLLSLLALGLYNILICKLSSRRRVISTTVFSWSHQFSVSASKQFKVTVVSTVARDHADSFIAGLMQGWARDVNTQDRDETDTFALTAETIETLVRPSRDRDEKLRNSRPPRGVIKVIGCSRQGWSSMARVVGSCRKKSDDLEGTEYALGKWRKIGGPQDYTNSLAVHCTQRRRRWRSSPGPSLCPTRTRSNIVLEHGLGFDQWS